MSLPLTLPQCGVESMAYASDLAVVIVDMQKDYLGYTTKEKYERIIPAHHQLIEVCRLREIPIVVMEMDCAGYTVTEIRESLARNGCVPFITKDSADSFWRTTLGHVLCTWGSRNLVVTGCLASACVKTTIEAAHSRNYRVRTAEVLIADEDCDGIEMKTHQRYRELGCLCGPSLEELLGPH